MDCLDPFNSGFSNLDSLQISQIPGFVKHGVSKMGKGNRKIFHYRCFNLNFKARAIAFF